MLRDSPRRLRARPANVPTIAPAATYVTRWRATRDERRLSKGMGARATSATT
jgi:hypothetical protein